MSPSPSFSKPLRLAYMQLERFEALGEIWTAHLAFSDPMPLTINIKNVEWMLQTNFKNYDKGTWFKQALYDLIGEMQRKIASYAFTQSIFRDFMFEVMARHVKGVARVLIDNYGQTIKFFEILNRMTLDAIGEIGFGQNLDCLENYPNDHPFLTCFDRSQLTINRRMFRPWYKISKFLAMGDEGQMLKDIKTLRTIGAAVVKDRKAKFESGSPGADFLSLFIAKAKADGKENELHDKKLVDLCFNFLIAGRDTTATFLVWMFYELYKNPDVLQKCRDEIHEVLGKDEMAFEYVPKLKYLRQVQDETLRLHPSVPRDVRFAINDDTLPDGTFIRAGTALGYSQYTMGRSSKIWGPDSLEFKPERWDKVDQSRKEFQFEFPVFHAGPRMCLGKRMAYMEMTIAMVYLLPLFDFELMQEQPVTYIPTITLAVKGGLPMQFKRKEDVNSPNFKTKKAQQDPPAFNLDNQAVGPGSATINTYNAIHLCTTRIVKVISSQESNPQRLKNMAITEEQKKQLTYVAVGVAAVASLYLAVKLYKGQAVPENKSTQRKPTSQSTRNENKISNSDPKDNQIWTVTGHKTSEGRYGMVWKNTRQVGRCLKITDLKPQGAIAKMNKSLPPNTQIKPGDYIRAVNGQRAYEEMRNELGAESLTLELERVIKTAN
eukprot:gene521-632_t